MFAVTIQLRFLVLLFSYALAAQPVQPIKQQAVHVEHKKETARMPTEKLVKNATSHLRKSPTPDVSPVDQAKQTEKDKGMHAVSGLVNGLASLPTKGGKVIKGFANKANHPSVRALKPKPVSTGASLTVKREHSSQVSHVKISQAKAVHKAKSEVHQPKKVSASTNGKKNAQNSNPQHPALVSKAYPSLVPAPVGLHAASKSASAVKAGHHKASTSSSAVKAEETEAEREQKVQHAMDDSQKAVEEVDKDIEEARKEAAEAHKIAHGK